MSTFISMKKMRDTRIWMEDEQVHLYLPVKREGRSLLLLSSLLLLTFAMLAWSVGKMLLEGTLWNWSFALVALAFLMYFPVRYITWRLYGAEHIVIDTQKISYSYDYGIMRSRKGQVPYHVLGLGYQKQQDDPRECGNLIFYNYMLEEESVETLLETSVWVAPRLLVDLDKRIHELFVNERLKDFDFPPYSLN